MWVCEWFFFSWHSIELTGQFPCCLVFSFSNKRTQLETGLGGFRTGTSRYSEQILASTSWRITLSGIKLGKVEKMFTRQTNQKKKKLKRERERQTFTWIESSVCRDISLSLSQSKIEDDMGSLSALSRGEKFHQKKKIKYRYKYVFIIKDIPARSVAVAISWLSDHFRQKI